MANLEAEASNVVHRVLFVVDDNRVETKGRRPFLYGNAEIRRAWSIANAMYYAASIHCLNPVRADITADPSQVFAGVGPVSAHEGSETARVLGTGRRSLRRHMVCQPILSKPSLPVILVSLLYFAMADAPALAGEFCSGAPSIPFDRLATEKIDYLGKRVRTHAVVTTDAKEFTLFRQSEASVNGLLEMTDEEGAAYAKRMRLHASPFNFKDDFFFEKLRAAEGNAYQPDLTKIAYYRQDVSLCGRVVQVGRDYFFSVDDLVREKTYLVPSQPLLKRSWKLPGS